MPWSAGEAEDAPAPGRGTVTSLPGSAGTAACEQFYHAYISCFERAGGDLGGYTEVELAAAIEDECAQMQRGGLGEAFWSCVLREVRWDCSDESAVQRSLERGFEGECEAYLESPDDRGDTAAVYGEG